MRWGHYQGAKIAKEQPMVDWVMVGGEKLPGGFGSIE